MIDNLSLGSNYTPRKCDGGFGEAVVEVGGLHIEKAPRPEIRKRDSNGRGYSIFA